MTKRTEKNVLETQEKYEVYLTSYKLGRIYSIYGR